MLFSAISDWGIGNYLMALLDIAILAVVIYKLLMLIRGTRAVQLVKGLCVLLLVTTFSGLIGLHAVSWIMEQFWAVVFLAMVVIFQPELRRALERIGRGNLLARNSTLATGVLAHVINEVMAAAMAMSKTRTGALIVLERNTGLSDYIETGVSMDANVSKELLCNIFAKDTPLHDGAAIIRGERVAASACFLPLSDNPYISTSLGTRHRAGIGISEVSDSLVIIVSEETGIISLAHEGKLIRNLDERQLRDMLSQEMPRNKSQVKPFWRKGAHSNEDQ